MGDQELNVTVSSSGSTMDVLHLGQHVSSSSAIDVLHPGQHQVSSDADGKKSDGSTSNLALRLLYCSLAAVGTVSGPMLLRLYYLHGGNRKWLPSWLQTAGFPLLLFPLAFIYLRRRRRASCTDPFMADPKVLAASVVIGLIMGLTNFLYSVSLAFLSVSTTALLFSTQLAFTALFARVIVKQSFTFFSINAVVLMTLGAVLLGFRENADKPPGVTGADYTVGFVVTLGGAALAGFMLPAAELIYTKITKTAITYTMLLQFQLGVIATATVFCTVGMLVNRDFPAMSREAAAFGLGERMYYLVLVVTALAFTLLYVGNLGLVFCTSSLFTGVLVATLLPMTEVAGVIFYHEKFTADKGLSLALCLWGFASYFYGSYKSRTGFSDQITSSS